jgi:hypothetical protein
LDAIIAGGGEPTSLRRKRNVVNFAGSTPAVNVPLNNCWGT